MDEAPNLLDYLNWRITSGNHYGYLLAGKSHPALVATYERLRMEIPLIQSVRASLTAGKQDDLPDYLAVWYRYLNLCAWTYSALTDYHHDAAAHAARVQLLHARDAALSDLIYHRIREAI